MYHRFFLALIEAFNNDSVEEYLGRSYLIVAGKAEEKHLPNKTIKTFLHISLCRVMKAFAEKVNKCFKKERNFVKFVISLLANSFSLSDAFEICEHFFKLLICKFSADCKDCKSFLEEKMKEFQIGNSIDPNQILDGDLPITTGKNRYKNVQLKTAGRSIF